MDIWLDDPRSGDLVMDRAEGLVTRHLPDGETEDLGFIGDPDNAPFDRLEEWEALHAWWVESAGGGHERECRWTYENLCCASLN